MTPSNMAPVSHGSRTARVEMLSLHLGAATAELGRIGPRCGVTGRAGSDLREAVLDDVTECLRRLEGVLGGMAGGDIDADEARQLRALRDAVSVHLSAASSLRLLDLDDNAEMVLRRAVDSARRSMTALMGRPLPTPL